MSLSLKPIYIDIPNSLDKGFNVQIPGNWFDVSFKNRVAFIVKSNQIDGGIQTDFPVLIDATIPNLFGNVQVNGEDIRVVLDNVQLDYEIQFINDSTGKIIIWAKVPNITNGTKIYIYYNNPTAIDQQDAEQVWTGYTGVYHFQDLLKDSAETATLIKVGTAVTTTPGKIGDGVTGFNATDYLNGDGITSITTQKYTLSAWVKLPTGTIPANGETIFSQKSNVFNIDSTAELIFQRDSTLETIRSTDVLINDTFTYVVVTHDGIGTGDTKLYVNGVLQPDTTAIPNLLIGSIRIGSDFNDSTRAWLGVIDEFRHRATTGSIFPVLTPSRIKTEFNNQNDVSSFFTQGSPETFS